MDKEDKNIKKEPSSAEASASDKSSADKPAGEEPKKSEQEKPALNELEECQRLKDEYLAGGQRARADFLNYKKEEMERIGEFLKYAAEEFVLRILPVLDNFEIVEKKLPEGLKNNNNVKGLLQIKNQLQDFLKAQGVEEIKCLGQKFDPNFMEAVEQVEMKDKQSGTVVEEDKSSSSPFATARVIEEIQKGYKINGRLLRPAKVKVVKIKTNETN